MGSDSCGAVWGQTLKKLYVGNLSYRTTETELETAFASFGQVISAAIVRDRQTGDSRGFGFIEMNSDDEASAAIAALNGSQLSGRTLTVNEARPRAEQGGRSGGGGGYGGGGRGY